MEVVGGIVLAGCSNQELFGLKATTGEPKTTTDAEPPTLLI
jgi:hypothetical protein